MIGKRHEEILKRVEECIEHLDYQQLDAYRCDFLAELKERLETHQEKTYMTARQLNFLTQIEGELNARVPWS